MANPQPGTLAHGNNAGTLVPLKVSSDGTLATSGAGGGGSTVAIDQTTPGTTNAVQITAGAAVIGHVIVDSGGGGGTQYTEDVASAADPIGTMPILVRLDTLVAITSADGDNIAARGTNKGEAYTHDTDTLAAITASAIPVGAGTSAAAGRVTTASDSPDVATLGATSGAKVITDANGTIQQYLRGLVYLLITSGQALVTASLAAGSALIGKVGIDQTTPGTTNLVAAGQNGTWTVQPGNTANTTAWKVDGSAVTQPVSVASIPSHAVTNAGTFATQAATTIADGADVTLGAKADAKSTATDTTSITLMQVAKQISASVQAPPSQAVTNAGTFAVQPKGSSATNVAIADNPVNLGVQAVSSENTAVTTARQVQLVADLVGKLIVLPYANPENFVSGAITSAMTGTTSTSLVAAPAAGLRNYITQITVSNAHATVGTDVAIQDGSGGTTLYTIPAAAVYGGAVVTFPTPLRQPTTATALYCANVTTGASTKVSASGYKGA